MNNAMRKVFLSVVGFFVVVATLAAAWVVIEYKHFARTPLEFGTPTLHYEVKPGTNVREIAHDLAQRGVIPHRVYLVALAQWQGRAQHIKAGEYQFDNGITPVQLLDQLVAGQVFEHTLTVVEGWTFRQLLEAVKRHPMLTHTLTGLSDAQIMDKLGFPNEHPEGRFYPDTYRFPKGTTDVAFLRRAYLAMDDYLNKAWPRRSSDLPLSTPYQALILASIVEKETAQPSERTIIAGVFLRRLEKGMRLQTDPTVIYGLGANFDGNLRRRDLSADNPYNTYMRTGLPPTPIALPGRAAINAVLHPAPGDSLYFVSRGDGSHEFSDNFEAHNRAVKRYQPKARAGTSGK